VTAAFRGASFKRASVAFWSTSSPRGSATP
jgi:hypothetical protein